MGRNPAAATALASAGQQVTQSQQDQQSQCAHRIAISCPLLEPANKLSLSALVHRLVNCRVCDAQQQSLAVDLLPRCEALGYVMLKRGSHTQRRGRTTSQHSKARDAFGTLPLTVAGSLITPVIPSIAKVSPNVSNLYVRNTTAYRLYPCYRES